MTLDRHSPPDAGIAQRGTLDAVIRRYAYHIEIDVLEEAIGFKLELSLRSGQEGFGIKLFDQQCNLPAHLPLALAKAAVEVVEPTGAETHAVLKIGEREIIGRFDPDHAPRLGEQLPLGIDMSHACLFDPNTQALVPQAVV